MISTRCSVIAGPTPLEFIGVTAGTTLVAVAMFAVVLAMFNPAPPGVLCDRRAAPGPVIASVTVWFSVTALSAWGLVSMTVF